MGLNTILLTGDARNVATWTAKTLKVEVCPEMLPEEKMEMEYVKDLVDKGRRVAMVGDDAYPGQCWGWDGIRNHVARESADVVLIGNDLSKFVETIKIAHRCRRIIMQNFWGTLIVDSIGVCMAAVDSSIHSLPHSSMSVPSLPLSSTPLACYPAEAADAIDPGEHQKGLPSPRLLRPSRGQVEPQGKQTG